MIVGQIQILLHIYINISIIKVNQNIWTCERHAICTFIYRRKLFLNQGYESGSEPSPEKKLDPDLTLKNHPDLNISALL